MTRRIIAAVAALFVALIGSVAVVAYARAADQRALAGQEAVQVFVAEQEVPGGTTAGKAVEQGLIAEKLIARAAVPEGALTSIDGGYDQLVATSTIQPGEMVMRARFSARGATEGALSVPEKMFAVSIALDDPSHVGPFVAVGSRVAVFDTFNIAETVKTDVTPAGDHLQDRHEYTRATRLLLSSVEVLAVGDTTTTTRHKKADAAAAAAGTPVQVATTTFTLAVTQTQAELLIHGARTGTLTFALIGPGAKATPGQGVTDPKLFEVAK